jgi:DNA polymerase-3 subunit delta
MAALKAHEVGRWLQRPDLSRRVVLFYGPDGGLVRERARALIEAASSGEADPFGRAQIDADTLDTAPHLLIEEVSTIGLFGGRRVLRVIGTSQALVPALQAVLSHPSLEALVVVEGGDLQAKNPVRLLVEREAGAMALPCYGDDGKSLDQLIDETVRAHGCTIRPDTRGLLAARLGSDRAISRREIEKLCLHAGPGGAVTDEAIEQLVGDSAVRGVDRVVDAAFSGKLGALDLAHARLRDEGVEAGTLLQAVMRHAVALLDVHAQVASGTAQRDALSRLRGMPFPRRAIVEAALGLWTPAALEELVAALGRHVAHCRRQPALAEELAQRVLWNLATGAARRQRG